MRVLIPGRNGICRCWFLWKEETRRPREKPSELSENQQQTLPTYMAEVRNRTQATMVGGECSRRTTSLRPKTCCVEFDFTSSLNQNLFNTFAVEEKRHY